MPIKVLMPALSPTMTEGKLARWLKKEGDAVKSGQVLCEIETDKATMEVEAVDEGTLGKILVADGTEGVKVNEPIALILEEGENASALAAGAAPAAPPTPTHPPKGGGRPAVNAETGPPARQTPPPLWGRAGVGETAAAMAASSSRRLRVAWPSRRSSISRRSRAPARTAAS